MHYPFLALLVAATSEFPTTKETHKRETGSFKLPIHRRDTGTATANSAGAFWTVPILLGDQEFSVLLDTGSADLWISSTDLPPEEQGNHNLYNRSASSTARVVDGAAFEINYTIPGASGYVVTEDVNIGDAIVKGMPIGVATHLSEYLTHKARYDGILGLAFTYGNSIRPNPSPTFMELLPHLPLPLFTVNLPPLPGQTGTLEFGYIDPTLYTGPLSKAPINNATDGSWTVDNVVFKIGDEIVGQQSMLFDTGAGNFMLVDPNIADAYYSRIKSATKHPGGAQYWGFPCETTLADLKLQMGNGTAVVRGKYMSAGLLGGDRVRGLSPLCTGALQSSPFPSDQRATAGAPFFQAQFMVFDQGEPSVLFADRAG